MRTDFWKVGAMLLGLLIIVLLVQFTTWTLAVNSAEADAKAVIRLENPRLDWAFAEWERCNTGQGDYAKNGYITKEQCNMAIAAQAKTQGNEKLVRQVFNAQQFQLNDAANKVQPAWPLSIMANPIYVVIQKLL
ncbi:MAG: hypothetical protein CTY35_02015 [Methylotenera sp.]|uniref:hypothetical protein n=1 Tax=Methylotenera sp. TaxID=2051956 RepID=UPI000D3F11D9|nr:hypothetical protein [Methylotenera sp.]PPC84400.1 MAG: hypothetical protein CTY38_02235 [Methylotenera sp.]PPD01042.1 MAG: hypothetical protein CTY35_02015 [Methylotenera sp.]